MSTSTSVPPQYRCVLLPLDGSPGAERALEPARWLAAHFGAELHTVTAGVSPSTRWYRNYAARLVHRAPGIVTHTAESGEVADAVAALTRELNPCLVCIGTHGRARSATLVGSAFVDVARALDRPLVAVGPRAILPLTERHGRIVACVDGTPGSELVLPLSAAWARRLGLDLSIAAVVEPVPAPVVPEERHHGHRITDPHTYLARLASEPSVAGLDVDTRVAWDPLGPHHGLTALLAAEPATLVALASRVRSGGDRMLHGSEAAHIIHASPSPVLVLPAPA